MCSRYRERDRQRVSEENRMKEGERVRGEVKRGRGKQRGENGGGENRREGEDGD